MILEIKDIVSSDVTNVWEWHPKNLEEIYFVLEMEIGYKNRDSADVFQVVVATPEAIRSRQKHLPSYIPGREYFIVLSYSWENLEKELTKIVESCSCEIWEECVKKLTKYFLWEYEDHEYHEYVD